MQKTMEEIQQYLRSIANEMSDAGRPELSFKLGLIADQMTLHMRISESGANNEVTRLRSVIKSAIEMQTNEEVRRWLSAALSPGMPIFRNYDGKRVDMDQIS